MTQETAVKGEFPERADTLSVTHARAGYGKPPLIPMGQTHETGSHPKVKAAEVHDGELTAVIHLREHVDVPRPCPEGQNTLGVDVQLSPEPGAGHNCEQAEIWVH